MITEFVENEQKNWGVGQVKFEAQFIHRKLFLYMTLPEMGGMSLGFTPKAKSLATDNAKENKSELDEHAQEKDKSFENTQKIVIKSKNNDE